MRGSRNCLNKTINQMYSDYSKPITYSWNIDFDLLVSSKYFLIIFYLILSLLQAFSKDGYSQTIRAKDQSREHEIGRVYLKGLSFSDIKVVNLMYDCNSKYQRLIENCTILIPKGNSYCRRNSSARGPRFKVSSEGLSAEIDIPLQSPIHVQTKADVA